MTNRILLFRMVDPNYPRSKRIVEYLRSMPSTTIEQIEPATGNPFARHLRDALSLFRTARRGDVVHLAEMQLQSIVVAATVARLRGCRLVVDGFIGLHETYVGDWAIAAPRSLRARVYRALDLLARRAADCYLIDTEVRAVAVRAEARCPVIALEVGAPAWAQPAPRPVSPDDELLRILYYGNYIPLHGVDTVIEALRLAAGRRAISVTFLGDGAARAAAERRVHTLGLSDVVTFSDPVPEHALRAVVHEHDVVLGVFGNSPKAATVIANKVWQGLACGRTVITRQAAALDIIAPVAEDALVQVPAEDAPALADALVATRASRSDGGDPAIASRLDDLVQRSYVPFGDWVRSAAQQSGAAR